MYKVMKRDTFDKFEAAADALAELMETPEGYDKFYRDFLHEYIVSVDSLPVSSERVCASGFTFYIY